MLSVIVEMFQAGWVVFYLVGGGLLLVVQHIVSVGKMTSFGGHSIFDNGPCAETSPSIGAATASGSLETSRD